MKKYLTGFLLLFLTSAVNTVEAQVSNNQIVNYAKTQSKAGASQAQIAKDLMSQGASVEQLQELRSQYLEQGTESSIPSETAVASALRTNNGELQPAEVQPAETGKKIFGHDIFRSQTLSFEPSMNIATPTDYVLGPGDEVILDIYGASQQNSTCKVSPEGTILIPGEGPVHVAGLTSRQAQAKVQRTIGGHYADSNISLSIGQTRSVVVNVLGEVQTPGTYTLSAFSNVFNALYLSGGVNEIGTLRDIQVSRNGKVIAHVDIYDFILNGKLTGNIILKDNDVIRVNTYKNLVQIDGKVKRPMYYELKDGETLQQLLEYAGGFQGDAYREKVRIERASIDGLTVHNVEQREFSSFLPLDGDVAVVGDIIQRYKNTVTVEGAVFRPGKYKLGGEVISVKSLVEQAGGLMENAVTTRAILQRMRDNRTLETQTLALGAILNGQAQDVTLRNEDQLIIASYDELESLKTVTISGEVFHPGTLPYSYGESVQDLITRAGGLKESASLSHVEIARRITDAANNTDGKAMAQIFNITLRNGLVIEGDAEFKLEPYDMVSIRRSPDYKIQHAVTIEGEVLYAGNYTLSNKEERLSDIIKRSGGITQNAYLGGAQIIRQVTEKERMLLNKQLEMAQSEQDSLTIQTAMEKNTFVVGTNFEQALNNPGGSADVILAEGDLIQIPQMENTVKISGGVFYPNTIAYEKGKAASYYINQAGGISKTGRRNKTYIVYANGQVTKASKGKVLPGCEIVVPQKDLSSLSEKREKTSMWVSIASTITSVLTVIAYLARR